MHLFSDFISSFHLIHTSWLFFFWYSQPFFRFRKHH